LLAQVIIVIIAIDISIMSLYTAIRSEILHNLDNNLSNDLYYHCLDHTLDVEFQAERIAVSEKITDTNDLFLLKVACLYHDSGFLTTYKDHEVASCKLAQRELPKFGIVAKQLAIICGLIMATKIPQTPLTKLEEIICDADLDYLGRDDFAPISHNLFLELKNRNFVQTENDWNLIQIKFFKQHNYFTDTNQQLRHNQKMNHLLEIEALIV
jgi:HD superfamily phosphodiesterase